MMRGQKPIKIMIIYSAFVTHLRKKWEYNKAVHHLFMGFKTAHDSVRREAVCNILIEFGSPSYYAVTFKKTV
jgi:hypothetical protein